MPVSVCGSVAGEADCASVVACVECVGCGVTCVRGVL